MKGASSLRRAAVYHKIFTPAEIKKVKLPKIHFYNARNLRFKDNYFDLVISQVSIQYVDRKDHLLEEVWRVLKKGGKAFLNIDARYNEMPDFLDFETPRFIIYKKGKLFPVKKLVSQLKRKGYDISYRLCKEKEQGILKHRVNIIMNKNTQKRFRLNLNYVKDSSFDIGRINLEKDQWSTYWGYRSVFRI
jgi:ubiquinone/menaquinone biosynthesis C-methylase UbiE